MTELPVTRWRLVHIPALPDRLDIVVMVDSVAPLVVEAVEQAAEQNGIELVRLREDE